MCKHLLWYQCTTVCRSIAVCCSVLQYLRSWRRLCIQAFALVSIFLAQKPPRKARSKFVPTEVAMHKSICSGIDFFPLARNTYTHTHTRTYKHTHTHTRTHIHARLHAHTYMHTHTPRARLFSRIQKRLHMQAFPLVSIFFARKPPKKQSHLNNCPQGVLKYRTCSPTLPRTPLPLFPSFRLRRVLQYGVATIGRLFNIIGLFCKRAL